MPSNPQSPTEKGLRLLLLLELLSDWRQSDVVLAAQRESEACALIEGAADLAEMNLEGRRPLTSAIEKGLSKIALLIIAQQRCDVNIKRRHGFTPLMRAPRYCGLRGQNDFRFHAGLVPRRISNLQGARGNPKVARRNGADRSAGDARKSSCLPPPAAL